MLDQQVDHMASPQEDPAWKIFFRENPQPSNFGENVAVIREACQQSAAKKQRVALVTVYIKQIIFGVEIGLTLIGHSYKQLTKYVSSIFIYSLVGPQFPWKGTLFALLITLVLEQEDLHLPSISLKQVIRSSSCTGSLSILKNIQKAPLEAFYFYNFKDRNPLSPTPATWSEEASWKC